MAGQTNDRTSHLRSWHKTVRRNICHDIRLCIILYCQRQCPVIFRSRSYLHPVRYFFLYHDSDGFHRHMTLKQPHDDRCCDIIRKICHYFDWSALIIFIRKFRNVQFQDIFIDHGYIIIITQRILQNRNQAFVDLYRTYFSRRIRQILCHRSDSRSDLQDKIIFGNLRCTDDLIQHMGINQKVLPELFLKCKAVFIQHSDGCLGITKVRLSLTHSFSFLFYFLVARISKIDPVDQFLIIATVVKISCKHGL